MSDNVKSILLRLTLSVCMLLMVISIPTSMFGFSYSLLLLAVAVFGTITTLHLLEKVDRRLPRKPPVRQLAPGRTPAPGVDSVTIPNSNELWRAPLYIIPIMGILILLLFYTFGVSEYRDWFPGIIVVLFLVYVNEAFTGPLRRWWIANIFGEWSLQKWSQHTPAVISYPVDAWRTEDPVAERAFHFFGSILFRRYLIEVYLPTESSVGYLNVTRKFYDQIVADPNQKLLVEIRRSKLHPKRLQLRLAQ